jgi:DNA-binding transcriptional regulator PaaX
MTVIPDSAILGILTDEGATATSRIRRILGGWGWTEQETRAKLKRMRDSGLIRISPSSKTNNIIWVIADRAAIAIQQAGEGDSTQEGSDNG